MKIKFMNAQHYNFFKQQVQKTGNDKDSYHKALFYTLGLTEETRSNIEKIYNSKERCIEFDALRDAWQTGTSVKVCRLAFNLFNGLYGQQDRSENPVDYTPYGLFDSGLIVYMLEAVKIRYADFAFAEEF